MEIKKYPTSTLLLSNISIMVIAFLIGVYTLVFSSYPFQSSNYTILMISILLIIFDKRLGLYYLIFAYPIIKRVFTFTIGFEPALLVYYPYVLCFFILFYDNIFYNTKIIFYSGKINKIILFFLVYLILSLVFISTDKTYGVEKLKYLLLSLILFYIPQIFTMSLKDLVKSYHAIYLFGITLVVIGYIQFSGIDVFFDIGYKGRFSILGLNPIWIARFFSYAILVELYFLVTYSSSLLENVGKFIFVLFLIVLQSYFLFLTGSRGPLVGLFFGIFSVSIIRLRINIKAIMTIAIVVFLMFVIIGLFVPQDVLGRITTSNDAGKITALIRILSNIEALKYFASNVVFGIGFGSYKFGSEVIGVLQYPHNIFTEILSETGVIGFFLFIYLLIYILKSFIKTWKHLDINFASLILGLFIASFINANLSGHIGGNIYFWFSLGVMHFLNMRRLTEQSLDYN